MLFELSYFPPNGGVNTDNKGHYFSPIFSPRKGE